MKRQIRFNVNFKPTRAQEAEVQKRLKAALGLTAEHLSKQVQEQVREAIPNEGGWYSIYREALTYFSSKDGSKWAVSGLWPTELSAFPAERTTVTFTPRVGDVISETLASYNPWTVDQLPAISGGIRVEAKAKVASAAEVTTQRERLVDLADTIKQLLTDAGATYVNEMPKIQGKVYADVAFMALALEHGLAGLQRRPHWVKVWRYLTGATDQMVAPITDRVQRILDGDETWERSGEEMPPDLERRIGL